ncbi:MAG: hypothetical protein JOZ05_25275, partial [Acetobacteraceae bacterium]|nr:hypothetical protein [Acetobacteraceae bacterium]
ADYRHTFAVLAALPCDVFLGAHGAYFDMLRKLERTHAPGDAAVWIDPRGYHDHLEERRRAFERELARQSGP